MISTADLTEKHLWVVREHDVVHASEACEFGRKLESRVVKHTNLTGGAPAFSAGEMLLRVDGVIVLNGASGRYGPRSSAAMDDVAKAFKKSGYAVWSMGYDVETARPFPFVGARPRWVE